MKFETKAIHTGQESDKTTGAVIPPIHQSSTYEIEDLGKNGEYFYSRIGNPTRAALEEALASLENGKYGLAFGSGMAAITSVISTLKAGDEIVASDDLYGGTTGLFDEIYSTYNIKINYVDGSDSKNFDKAINKNTKLVWLETPSNPGLKLNDIKAISEIAKSKDILVGVDNTFASPYFQNPLDLGTDVVAHSTTKYISGHSDLVGGVVITNSEELNNNLRKRQILMGGVPGPFDCFLQLRGIKTLALRMQKHEENAFKIAEFLSGHKKVTSVNYPGLESHPQHDLAKKQMRGFSGMVSFTIDGNLDAVKKIVKSTKIFAPAVSLGGVESLIGHPVTMTHGMVAKEKRERLGITDNLIRLSVGIENVEDLIEDLDRVLS